MTPSDSGPRFQNKMGAAIFAALFLCGGTAVWGQGEITVTAQSGGLELSGQYLGFDGEYLRLQTDEGEVTLDYERVTCVGADCPDPESWTDKLAFGGTPRLGELILPALVEGYARSRAVPFERADDGAGRFVYRLTGAATRQDAEFSFQLSDTDAGFAELLYREIDVLMATRALSDAELALGRASGLGDLGAASQVRVVAYDAVVPVVSPMSERRQMTFLELARIFGGDVGSWSVVGGPDLPVSLHLGSDDTGYVTQFERMILAPSGRDLSDSVTVHPNDTALVTKVLEDPGAIGLVSFETVGNAVPLPLTGACGLQTEANLDTVRTGDYPLSFPLYLHLPQRRLGPVGHDFLEWIGGNEAQRILRRIGVPGQMSVRLPISGQGERLLAAIRVADGPQDFEAVSRLAAVINGHDRLSPTFGFQAGETDLTPASTARLRALAQAMLVGEFQGQELLLLGFSDGRGQPAANLVLSERRAEVVRAELLDLLGGELPSGQTLTAMGMGDVMPLGCDDTPWGRRLNRRVELWAPVPAR